LGSLGGNQRGESWEIRKQLAGWLQRVVGETWLNFWLGISLGRLIAQGVGCQLGFWGPNPYFDSKFTTFPRRSFWGRRLLFLSFWVRFLVGGLYWNFQGGGHFLTQDYFFQGFKFPGWKDNKVGN